MPQPRVAIEQWRALIAVVEGGSYARAAEVLHKSQSAVTYSVQKLESQLGVRAFEIRGRKAVLTPTGELLYRRARDLLEEAESLERAAGRVSAGWEAELRVAVEVIFPTWLLLRVLDRFGQESPHTRIEVIESVIGGTQEALVESRVDLAITPHVPSGFAGELLMRLRAVVVTAPDHPLQKLGRAVTTRDLRGHRHVVVRDTGSRRNNRGMWIEAKQRWTVSHISTSIEAVRSGYGFAWFIEEKIREELDAGTLKPVRMEEGGERFADLYLVFADRESAGPGAKRLAELFAEEVAASCREKNRGR